MLRIYRHVGPEIDHSRKNVRFCVWRTAQLLVNPRSMTVIYRIALATFMGFALTVAIASHSIAQQQQLIGTWLLVSEITEFPDGKRLEGFGGSQKGILIFDRTGHYSSQLTGASRIKFASTRLQGTPEENKGVSAGSLAHFGTYSADAAGTTLTFFLECRPVPTCDVRRQKKAIDHTCAR